MIGLAIVGAGRIGHIHARNVMANPRAWVVCVHDPIQRNAEALAALTGARVAGFEEVRSAGDVDGVFITSPATEHARQLVDFARAGKRVLCEKPVSFDLAKAAAAVAALDSIGARCMMGFHRRYDARFRAARAAIVDGRMGRPFQMTISSHSASVPDNGYLSTSGGLFRDQTIHDFDVARFLLAEEFVSLYAVGGCLIEDRVSATGDIDTAMITMVSASGCQVHINNGRFCPSGYDQRVELLGTALALSIENVRQDTAVWSDADAARLAPPLPTFKERYEQAFRTELDAFLDFVEGSDAPVADQNDGYQAQRLAEAALRSLRTGLPVDLRKDLPQP